MEHHYQESCFTIMVNLNAEIQPRILDRFVSYLKLKSMVIYGWDFHGFDAYVNPESNYPVRPEFSIKMNTCCMKV